MAAVSPETIGLVVHQIGALLWLGSLFFVRLVVLRVTKAENNPMIRMRFRIQAYKHMFRWGTLGLLLFWGSSLWGGGMASVEQLPQRVWLVAGAAALTVALHLFSYLALYLNMEEAVDGKNLLRAAKNNFWMRKLIWVNLFLGLTAAVLGATGPHLFR